MGGAEGDYKNPASSSLGALVNTWCDTLGGRCVPVRNLALPIWGGMTSPTTQDTEEPAFFPPCAALRQLSP